MTKLITNSEYETLVAEAQQSGEALEKNEDSSTQFILPQKLGSGGQQDFRLQHNCSLSIINGQLRQPMCLQSFVNTSQTLSLGFHLSGSVRITNPGLKVEEDRVEEPGSMCAMFVQNIQVIEQFPAGQPIQSVSISINLDALRLFSTGWNTLPERLRHLIEGKDAENFHQSLGIISPAMQRILKDVLTCPYRGVIQQIYLEGKILELLALVLSRWVESDRQELPVSKLRRSDVERLHLAKEIMGSNLEDPPSLLELARQVGFNDYKLKWGFRRLFGMTVFEYVHNCQMQKAQQLLAETQLNITEIAHTVGYASLSSFSKAFTKRLGMAPREYRDRYC
jgi:AraC family transcriptional regulator, transcriptional activator of the genes for pyochelin and ferripyochelin receptors